MGIPRFVASSTYADAFGLQWKRYRLAQLDSYTGVPISASRVHRCLGEALWDELAGKHVLECGCGAGRFTEVLLDRGACVTSIDLSDAVVANQDSFPQNEQHRIASADITNLPFAPQQYDVVFCLGVIQHTPDPERTIACLYDQVRPGGALVIDHYRPSLSWYTKSAPLVRRLLRRLPPERGLAVTEWLVDTLLPLHRATQGHPIARKLVSRVSPVLCYYDAYPELSAQLQREWALVDTHDALTDWYKHFRTRKQIRATLERLGLAHISCEVGGNGVEALGWRPIMSASHRAQ